MTNRIPLIVNAGAAQIQEVSASDVLTVPGTVSANVVQTDNYQYANGQPFAGGGGNYGNSNVATFLADFGSNTISTTGDVTANAFVGDGSQLTNLPLATNSTVGVVALGNGFTLNSSNQVTTSSLYNTNLTQPTQHYALRVDTNGVVILPDQSIINGSILRAVAGSYAGLTTDDGENSWMWVDSTGAYIATQYNESGNSHQWTFDNTGNLTLPGNGEISINYANGQPYGGTGSGGAAGNAGDIQINVAGGLGADSTLRYVDNGGEMTLYADYLNAPGIFTSDIYAGDGTPSNITLTTSYGNATWTFNDLGGTVFPTLTVQRGDNPSGTITGQTLLFGDSNQEAIISTPDGVPGNEYSQRLVINPGAGNNYGEGGDIYLWAGRGGDGSGSGGDIKIRGGQGGANTVGGSGGDGGYIRIEAGDAASTGGYAGYIDITGGTSNAVGGYVTITGGSGQTQGGDANINGGFTNSGPGGRVNINGGGSGSGLSQYGNVNIVAGASTWAFDNTGNLTIPGNINYANGVSILASSGNVSSLVNGSQTLSLNSDGTVTMPLGSVIKATTDSYTGISTSNGNTFAYVNSGGFYVNTLYNTADYEWHFDNTGTLTLPDGTYLAEGGFNAGSPSATVSMNAYSPDGNTVSIQAQGNTSSIVLQTIDNANALINNWTFDSNGNLTLPQGGVIYETAIPGSSLTGNTIALLPSGGTDPDQQLLVYPTAGPTADDNHLHLTSGNLWNTELFLGNDNFYVKLANTGNVVINSNDDLGNSAQWTFGIDGHFNVPQGGWIGAAGVKGDGTMLTGGTGNIASLTSFYADAPGVYSSCVTVNPNGTLNITTYGNGTGQLGQWVFSGADLSGSGNLSLNGGEITGGVTTTLDDTIYSITLGTTTVLNINGVPFTNPARGQVTISGITSTTQANGTWYYQAVGVSNLQLYTNGTYATPVDSTAWTPYTSGDGSVYFSQVLPSANITLNSNGYLSTFTSDGQVILPGSLSVAGDISAVGNVYARNIVAEAPFEIQVYNFNADIGGRYGVDTQTNTVTATLPATPPTGGAVFFADAAGAYNINNLIIDPNGGTIMGATGNMTVSTPNQSVGLFYNGTTWRIYNAG